MGPSRDYAAAAAPSNRHQPSGRAITSEKRVPSLRLVDRDRLPGLTARSTARSHGSAELRTARRRAEAAPRRLPQARTVQRHKRCRLCHTAACWRHRYSGDACSPLTPRPARPLMARSDGDVVAHVPPALRDAASPDVKPCSDAVHSGDGMSSRILPHRPCGAAELATRRGRARQGCGRPTSTPLPQSGRQRTVQGLVTAVVTAKNSGDHARVAEMRRRACQMRKLAF